MPTNNKLDEIIEDIGRISGQTIEPDSSGKTTETKLRYISKLLDDYAPMNEPEVAGTAGQVLTSDGEGGQIWADIAAGEVVIDNTLSIQGAAAESKKTGEEITSLKSAVAVIEKVIGTGNITPAQLQAIAASGRAGDYFDIGDIIYIPWTDNTPSTPVTYQYPFVVAHIGDVYDEDDVLHENGLWLMAMYAEPQEIQFDAAEGVTVDLATEPNALDGWYYWGVSGDTYTALNLSAGDAIPTTYDSVRRCWVDQVGILRYGYNRWSKSAYRQWLNSDAAKNANWWTPQHEHDVAPSSTYTDKPGWLYGFTEEWKAIFKPVKVQTATNTVTDGGVTDVTYDTFFLPSIEQMYGVPQVSGVEGDYWEYWKEEMGVDAPTNGSSRDTNNARKIPSIAAPTGSAVYCRLRSALRSYGDYVWNVYTAGYLYGNHYGAYDSYRCLPACVIY